MKVKGFKYLSKRIGKFKDYKKFIRKTKSETMISFKTKESVKINKPRTEAHIVFGKFHSGKYWQDENVRTIRNISVKTQVSNKGRAKELLNMAFNRMKGKTVRGEVVSQRQVSVRANFPDTKLFNPSTKFRKAITPKYAKSLIEFKERHIGAVTKVPKKGFKKKVNRTTGKVRFIRKNGRVIPVRIK